MEQALSSHFQLVLPEHLKGVLRRQLPIIASELLGNLRYTVDISLLISQQPFDTGADALDLQRIYQTAPTSSHLRHGTAVGGDDRHTELEGFEDRQAEAFIE